MTKKYQITPITWLVKDETSVKFHVKNNDYFGTIACVLNLMKQEIKKDGCKEAAILMKILKTVENDLLFLQANYQIKPKSKKRKKIPKGKLINQ